MPTSEPWNPSPDPSKIDKKIRCTLGVQGIVVSWLAWDDDEISEMKKLINGSHRHLITIRTWEHDKIEVVPAHIGYLQRNDADGKF
jgi:hypothetical protein